MTDWSQIVGEHGPMVWRTAYRLVANGTDASDCFQRAFLSALELERTQAIRNWPGLLRRLVTARALECLRQRRRAVPRSASLTEAAVVDRKVLSPVQAAQARELAGQLSDALAELDPQQAQVFCMACLDGQSYQEIADDLGLTVNHVGVLLHRARAFLQRRLEAYAPSPLAQRLSQELPHDTKQ